MKRFTLAIILILASVNIFAQTVTNVEASQEGNSVVVSYDIDKSSPRVQLTVSTDGGKTFSSPLKKVSGDVADVQPGRRRIVWDVLSEYGSFTGDNIVFDVTAASDIEYVDLGLSVLWATCNLGASAPEGTGRYFMWGDVIGQTWDPDTQLWSNGGFSTDAPEFKLNSSHTLRADYDAAHVMLGGKWRMPTEEEFKELLANCTIKREKNYNYSGVDGYVFTSKKVGYKGISIFIPNTGRFYKWGVYWSSTPDRKSYDMAHTLDFSWMLILRDFRYGVNTIRPVREK